LLQAKEANALLEIIDASLRCKNEEDLRQLVRVLRGLVPFEFAMCVLSGISCSSTDPYRIINVSYPLSWLELYISEQFDRIDPVVIEHRLHFDLQYWSDSYKKHEGHEEFVSCAEAYGLQTGYSYGLRTESGNSASLFSFGGRSMKRLPRTCDILRRIVPHLHQALVRIVAPKGNRRQVSDPGLSSREKEVLKWVTAGKTNWEISQILAISERTVKFHVRNILGKVHAATRVQAVAISVQKGLVDIE
jgi:DNA-binding CsgD family transcriptional regulator